MASWRWIGRPPVVQLNACCTDFAFPHEHTGEISLGCHPYLKASASLKAPLCSEKPCSSIGNVPSHADTPFCARTVAFLVVLVPSHPPVVSYSLLLFSSGLLFVELQFP